MKYGLIRNKAELNGTCYFEFLPGKYQGKCWNEGAVFMTEDSVAVFEFLLREIEPDYDHYAFNEFSSVQVNQLVIKLEELADRLRLDSSEPLRVNKSSILKMLHDLIAWIKTIRTKCSELSILGL